MPVPTDRAGGQVISSADINAIAVLLNALEGHDHGVNDLTDVDTGTTTPEDGDVLTYSISGGGWVPLEPVGGGGGTTNASDLTSGTLGLERSTPGAELVIDYYKTVYGGASAYPATRPSARTDISFIWRGPTDPGTKAIAGDPWDVTG